MNGQRTQYTECFEQLYMTNLPSRQLQIDDPLAADDNRSLDKAQPSLDKVRKAVARSKSGELADI